MKTKLTHALRSQSIAAIILIATLLAIPASRVCADVISGPIINPANGHSYLLLSSDNWVNSEAEAVSLGGYLVTINDAAENDWVFDNFEDFGGVHRYLWIGLYDPVTNDGNGTQHASDFQWVSGEASSYVNWGPNEPDNNGGQEYYGMMWRAGDTLLTNQVPGTWNDAPVDLSTFVSSQVAFGVVEIAPEPSTWALLCLGVPALLGAFLRSFLRGARPSALSSRLFPSRSRAHNQRKPSMKTKATNSLRCHSIAAVIFAAALLAVPASAQTMSLFDGDFSSWNFTSSSSGGGSATMSLQSSGGNPGACLNVSTQTGMTHNGYGITESAWGIGVNPNWTITQTLDGTPFTVGYNVLAGPGDSGQGQSVGLIVQQGSAYYLDIISTPLTGVETSWASEYFTGTFDAANFRLQVGSGPSQPDFSGATPTTLGFTAFNGDSGDLTQYYDNIYMTIAPVPEPSTWALLCLGVPALLGTFVLVQRECHF